MRSIGRTISNIKNIMKYILLFKTLYVHYMLDYFYYFKQKFKMLQQNINICKRDRIFYSRNKRFIEDFT
jgi:hypothetical protein